MSFALLSLQILTGCGGSTEIDQPADPPAPHVVDKVERSGSYPVDGSVSVVTIKDGDTPVSGTFTEVSGEIHFDDTTSLKGASGTITVDIGSWESGLPLRDDRVKATFFQAATRPHTTLTLTALSGMGGKALVEGDSVQGLSLIHI